MSVFSGSAAYYDALYATKDYSGEAQYVRNLIRKYAPTTRSVLDLGCGTGRHALQLAQQGFRVSGVDRSAEMLGRAYQAMETAPPDVRQRLAFHEGDIRTVRLNDRFDVVLALFHVMSYQISNEDVSAAIATAANHLGRGGIFLFDCWYGPGVLTDPPVARVRQVADGSRRILRIADPVLNSDMDAVDVGYQFLINDSDSGAWEDFRETHRMRYFFQPEIHLFLQTNGFSCLACLDWMKHEAPGLRAWNAAFVAKKTA